MRESRHVGTTARPGGEGPPVFSERLTVVLDAIFEGEAPNAGRFCGNCYTPVDTERASCMHCNSSVDESRPVEKVPRDILAMFQQLRRRESLVVNSFAYAGMLAAVMIFIGVFYLLFITNAGVWWYVFDIVLLFVLARVLAGLVGGFIGDEVGYRYSRRKLAEEWETYEAERDGAERDCAD